MKNTGKDGIRGIIVKTIIITILIFLANRVYGQEISSETITTTFPETDPGALESAERFYEISERTIKTGYKTTLKSSSALRITIHGQERHIIVNNFSNDSVNLIFIGSGKTLFNRQLKSTDYVIFKIEDLNLQFTLYSANESSAQIELKLFEEAIPEDIDYFELFDVQIRLAEHTIYSPTDLTALIEFTNFGEGPSHIRIVYSIINIEGKEFYTGIDEKIVQTDEVMIKNFRSLDIPYGDYIAQTTIYYGDNQEATSEESFSLIPVPKSKIIKEPLLFIATILIGLTAVILIQRRRKKKTNIQPSLIA